MSSLLQSLFGFSGDIKEDYVLAENNTDSNSREPYSLVQDIPVSESLTVNREQIKNLFNIPTNSDLSLRDFNSVINGNIVNGLIVYIDGLVDSKLVSDNILEPLTIKTISVGSANIKDAVKKTITTFTAADDVDSMLKACDIVCSGSCIIFLDGCSSCFSVDVKKWEHRDRKSVV